MLWLVVLGSQGCGGGSQLPADPAVTDSAGVAIMEAEVPASDSASWILADRAVVLESGDGAEVLFGDRPLVSDIVGATLMTRGREDLLVLAMRNPPRVVAFSMQGRVRFAYGPLGEGPGELINVRDVRRYRGDSLAVFDLRKQAIVLLDSRGEYGREVALLGSGAGGVRAASLLGATEGGDFFITSTGPPSRPVGHQTLELRVARVRAAGAPPEVLLRLPGREMFFTSVDGGTVWAEPPFARRAYAALLGDTIVVVRGEELGVRYYDRTVRLLAIARRRIPERSVTRERARALISSKIGGRPDPGGQVRAKQEEMIRHQTLPHANGFLVDSRRREVWVRQFAVPGLDRDSATVFDRQGRWIGAIELPREAIVMVSDRVVYGVATRGDGTQQIVRFQVRARGRG